MGRAMLNEWHVEDYREVEGQTNYALWPLSYAFLPATVPLFDLVLILLSSVAAGVAYHDLTEGTVGEVQRYGGSGLAVAMLMVAALQWRGLYKPTTLLALNTQLREVALTWCFMFVALACIVFLIKIGDAFSRGAVILWFIFGALCLLIWRWIVSALVSRVIASGALPGPTVTIFAETGRSDLNEAVATLRRSGYTISRSFLIPGAEPSDAFTEAALEASHALIRHVRQTRVDEIIVVARWTSVVAMQPALTLLNAVPLPVKLFPDSDIAAFLDRSTCEIGANKAVVLKRTPLSFAQRTTKRAFDISIASTALMLLLPVLVLAAIAIVLDTRGPIIFRQWRGGYNGRRFRIYKFRTMTTLDNGGVIVQAQREDRRVTRVGRWLRKFSIDELPQLINVLNGNMSIVGPRPHALAHDETYAHLIAPYAARHNVKPGITGLAQVNKCRGETADISAMRQRVAHDLAYIERWSLRLDFLILLRTVREVIAPANVY
jgi:Undecaprenyl-phosphate glucose phosphotransferase